MVFITSFSGSLPRSSLDEIHTLEQEVLFLSDNTTTKEILTNIEELHQNLKELEIQTDIKLADTKQVVNTRLDNAVVELDKAVSDAEQKIKDQVAEVSYLIQHYGV